MRLLLSHNSLNWHWPPPDGSRRLARAAQSTSSFLAYRTYACCASWSQVKGGFSDENAKWLKPKAKQVHSDSDDELLHPDEEEEPRPVKGNQQQQSKQKQPATKGKQPGWYPGAVRFSAAVCTAVCGGKSSSFQRLLVGRGEGS